MKSIFLTCILFANFLTASNFTVWQEDPENPIFAPFASDSLPDDYFPSVLYSATQFDGNGDKVYYKMWHQAPDGLALSYSPDGVSWFLQGTVIIDPKALHPTVIYDKNGFGGGPYHYKMWYWTGSSSVTPPNLTMKFTESKDGVNWTPPVATSQDTVNFLTNTVAPSSMFHQFYGFGTVIYNPNATSKSGKPYTFPYVAFYDTAAAGIKPTDAQVSIALAYSKNGVNWTRYGSNPILTPSGKAKDWDGKYTYRASVIYLTQDSKYHMFYSGSNDDPNTGLFYAHGIGHASSNDGLNWKEDKDNPIFLNTTGPAWRIDHTLAPSVVAVATAGRHPSLLLQMWFSGGNSSSNGFPTDMEIGYATLLNPVTQ